MLDPLIHRKDRDISGAAEAPVVENRLKAPQYLWIPIRGCHHAVNEVGAGKVQSFPGEPGSVVGEEALGLRSEKVFDAANCGAHAVLSGSSGVPM